MKNKKHLCIGKGCCDCAFLSTQPQPPAMSGEEWEEEFKNQFKREDMNRVGYVDIINYEKVKSFIRTLLATDRARLIEEGRIEAYKECIALSDKEEAGNETEFNEWRAFKGFRNALRDKLSALND